MIESEPNITERLQESEALPKFEILYDLREISQDGKANKVGHQLVYDAESTRKDTFVIFGLPGVGKTMLAKQMEVELVRRGFETQTLHFDDIVAESGLDTQNYRNITPADWEKLSIAWLDKILKTRKKLDELAALDKRKRVLLVDTMSVGRRDRGVSTLKGLGDYSREEKKDRFKFISLVPHPKIQDKSMQMRKRVLEKVDGEFVIDNNDLPSFLRTEFGVEVVAKGDDELVGSKIRATVGNMSAPEENWFKKLVHEELTPTSVRKILNDTNSEWFPEILELLVDAQELVKSSLQFRMVYNNVQIPDEIKDLSLPERENFRLLQAYFSHYSREVSIDNNYLVAFSPYKETGVHWYLDSEAENLQDPLPSKTFIIRHGQQDRYRKTKARLTELGKTQMEQFTKQLIRRFNNQRGEYNVHILTSNRLRTISAGQTIRKIMEAISLDGVNVKTIQEADLLNTADIISVFMATTSPAEEELTSRYLNLWLNADHDVLVQLDVPTPGYIAESTISYVKNRSDEEGNKNSRATEITIMVTHETSVGAILKMLGVEFDYVPHAGFIEIEVDRSGDMIFFYNGKQYQKSEKLSL